MAGILIDRWIPEERAMECGVIEKVNKRYAWNLWNESERSWF